MRRNSCQWKQGTLYWIFALFAAIFLFTRPAFGDLAALPASMDNSIYEEEVEFSNGAGDHFFAGNTKDPNKRRALIAFDIAANIPAGATIDSVRLTLRMSRTQAGTENISLHRALSNWGEAGSHADGEEGKGAPADTNDATWNYAFWPGTLWSTSGGDFSGTASATTPVGNNGYYDWMSVAMTADVQSWLDTPGTNYGWFVIGPETGTERAKRFDSRTNSNVSRRPELEVWYTPVQVVGACCFPGDSCAVVTAVDCAAGSGVYQGDGTTCSPDPCVVPIGACCFDDGTCIDTTAAECASQGGTYQGDGSACAPGLCPIVLTPFLDPLPIPGVATPTSGTAGGIATYDMAITQFQQQLHSELPPTTVWGYGGSYPGPTLETTQDFPITVNWINDLRDTLGTLRTDHFLPVDLCMHGPNMHGPTPRVVTHLHGGHVPPEVDGYPDSTFLPGDQRTYVYPNNQPAATLWYHDHALGITRLNVMMGLAGFYIVRDTLEAPLGLPAGSYEIPIVVQDRLFQPNGELSYPAEWQEHFFGDKILVNGKVWPYLNVDQGKYRFRLLNGSNSRTYRFSLSNAASFTQIGSDGGLLPEPVLVDTLVLTSGERADIVIDFAGETPGTEILLVNDAPAPWPGTPGTNVIPDVMKFVVQGAAGHTAAIPGTLTTFETLLEGNASLTRDFILEKEVDACAGQIWTINGLHWDDITEFPELDDTEIWRFVNKSGIAHPMHMHLVFFQVLDRQPFQIVADTVQLTGVPVPPDPNEAGWKDTAPVGPNEVLRVIARFEDYTGLYAYHCHILEHEDHEMMRQFQVVLPTSVAAGEPLPQSKLHPNRPNPFNPKTTLFFELAESTPVRIDVYDTAGRLVRTLLDETSVESGERRVEWDG
ncbi:MAG: multicopper oxidase domain-containing protein, partial [Gemmatimonadetes bacterium]|nr:multicopper oxidase domain-containing protein [Gemmatimonadota bacterium]